MLKAKLSDNSTGPHQLLRSDVNHYGGVEMSDVSTRTVSAKFTTREAADLAVEHLVQRLNVERTDIFVKTSGSDNSSGVSISGGDAPTVEEDARADAALGSEIEVSADIVSSHEDAVRAAFDGLGASEVSSA